MNSTEKKILILIAALGLLIMLGTTVYQRLSNPSLVSHRHTTAQKSPAGSASAPAEESETGRLMRLAGERPDDAGVQIKLGTTLIAQERYDEASVFLERASGLDINNADVAYYLGYIAHKKQDNEKAVSLMEESIRLDDRAEVRLNLAIIFAYYLKDKARAAAQLQAAMAAPDCTERVRAAAQAELDNLASSQ